VTWRLGSLDLSICPISTFASINNFHPANTGHLAGHNVSLGANSGAQMKCPGIMTEKRLLTSPFANNLYRQLLGAALLLSCNFVDEVSKRFPPVRDKQKMWTTLSVNR
jgi:hypothetical protein